MKKLTLTASVALVLVALGSAPFYCANSTQTTLNAIAKRFNESLVNTVTVSVEPYQSGYRHADTDFTLSIPALDKKLVVPVDITNGPFLSDDHGFHLGLADVVMHFKRGEETLDVNGRIGFDKILRVSHEWEGGDFDLGKILGQKDVRTTYSIDKTQFNTELASAPTQRIRTTITTPSMTSTDVSKIPEINEMATVKTSANNLRMSVQGKAGKSGFLVGRYDRQIDDYQMMMSIADDTWTANMKDIHSGFTSNEADDEYSMRIGGSVGSLQLPFFDKPYNVKSDYELRHLDANALAKLRVSIFKVINAYLKNLHEHGSDVKSYNNFAMGAAVLEMLQPATEMLKKPITFDIKEIKIQNANGYFTSNALIQFKPMKNPMVEMMGMAADKQFSVSAHMSFTQGFVDDIVTGIEKGQAEAIRFMKKHNADESSIHDVENSKVRQSVEAGLAELVKNGVLIKQHQMYASSFKLADGVVTLNDKVMGPLPHTGANAGQISH